MLISKIALGQIADIQAGPFGTQLHKSDYVKNGIPMLNAKNIGNGEVLTDSLDFVSSETCRRLNHYVLKKGDVLFGRAGSIDKHTYIEDNFVGCFQGTNTIRVRCQDIKVARYISYYLWLPAIVKQILNTAGKTTIKYIDSNLLKDLIINLLDGDKAQSISDYLFNFDRKIALNNAINSELEKAAKLLYDYWFVQFDFPNDEGKPYRASSGKMEYDEQLKREIPKGWRVDWLKNKLNMQRGIEPGSDAYSEVVVGDKTIPFIRVSDLGSKPSLYISKEAANGTWCKPTNILVSFDGSVGKIAVSMEGAYSSGIRKISPKDKDYSDALIYFIFRSEEIQKTIAKYAVGSNILHAASAIEHLIFPYSDKVTRAFMDIIEPIFKNIVANQQQNKELTALRNFLLPLLMNGQVTVRT